MSYLTRISIVVLVGVAAILFDKFLMPIPSPPGWLMAWAGWLALGLALLFGGKTLSDIGAALTSRGERK